jgi:hypothetical protein
MRRSRWGPLTGNKALGLRIRHKDRPAGVGAFVGQSAIRSPQSAMRLLVTFFLWSSAFSLPAARAAVKVSPGQEFLYSGRFEWKVSSADGPARTIAGPVKLSALVTEADPARGYAVVLMRRFQPEEKPGQANVPTDVAVTTLRYGADLKSTTPSPNVSPASAVIGALAVPLTPRAELKAGDQWRQTEALPALPLPPLELVYTVGGETKVGDRTCLKIEKKLGPALPYKHEAGGGTLELTDYGQTICVDPATGQVLSDQVHESVRRIAGEQRVTVDVNVSVQHQETRQLSTTELESRVKQAAALDRVQKSLSSLRPGADLKKTMDEAAKEVTAFRRDYPKSPYASALDSVEGMLGQMRSVVDREARLQGLKDRPAPTFTLKNLAGKEQTLGAYRGKIILLNFFASW